MRRLALAAVVGSLVLAACSDQSRQTPTEPREPGPSLVLSPTCSISDNLALIFPSGKGKTLLISAQEKVDAIIKSCQTGKLQDAQKKAIYFLDWMFKKFQGHLLIANPLTLITDLFGHVLIAVGLEGGGVSPDMVLVDGGTAVFEPGSAISTDLVTTSGFAALSVPSGSFDFTTLLVAGKLPNNTKLKSAQGRSQFPPFYDFNAINTANQHVLKPDHQARVEMCLYPETDTFTYPPDIRIGHNPVFGAPGYPFEVLEPDIASLAQCEVGAFNTGTPGGLQGLAVSAWRAAKRGMTAVFLPQPLRAATLALCCGSAAGKTSSLSPFGIVGPATLGFTQTGDPTGQTFLQNSTLTWQFCTKGCFPTYPAVRLVDAEGNGIGGVPITVTLVPLNGSTGALTTGGGGTITTSSGEGAGFAQFSTLSITEAGTYKLKFSAPGKVAPLTSGAFEVEAPPTAIPTTFGSGDWSYKQISNFDAVPSTWTTINPTTANGWTKGAAPFGTTGTCELATPATPWTLSTTMLLRRDVIIPANTASADIDILIDNDVHVFVNGWDVSDGLLIHEGCADLHPVHLTVDASSGPASAASPLVAGQVNKIFIRGVDRGGDSYLDAKMTLTSN